VTVDQSARARVRPRPITLWLAPILTWAVVALGAFNLALLAVLMLLRAGYPFELEWIEGATVNAGDWILAGHGLYSRPVLEFVPLLYTPLYFYLSAAAMALVGSGFLGPRLVSVAATVAGCWLIYALVRRETGQPLAGVVGAGFYAATFVLTAAWMDVARSDSLLVALLLLAAFVARRFTGWRGALACAAALVLAYLAKQSALPFFVAFGFYYLLQPRRLWLYFWPAAALLLLGVTWLLNTLTQDWYNFYTWYIVQQTVLDAERIRLFWTMDILPNVPLALLGAGLALFGLGHPLRPAPEGLRSRFYWIITSGAVAVSWWNRAAAGAHTNTLMPLLAWLGVLLGLLLGQWLARPPTSSARSAVLAGLIIQFALLAYDPRVTLPTAADEQAGRALVDRLAAYPGEVFIPAHSQYAAMAGKPTFAHWATITDTSGIWDTNLDVQHGGAHDPRRASLMQELEAAVAAQRFSAIILDDNEKELTAFWNDLLAPHYRLEGRLFDDDHVFQTVSGVRSRPQLVYVPR
jgi:hypothetical protein